MDQHVHGQKMISCPKLCPSLYQFPATLGAFMTTKEKAVSAPFTPGRLPSGFIRPGTQSSASLLPAAVYQAKEKEPLADILKRAGKRSLGGGLPGAAAMGVQVLSLMWLRTTVNYQYRYPQYSSTAIYKACLVFSLPRFLDSSSLLGLLFRCSSALHIARPEPLDIA